MGITGYQNLLVKQGKTEEAEKLAAIMAGPEDEDVILKVAVEMDRIKTMADDELRTAFCDIDTDMQLQAQITS